MEIHWKKQALKEPRHDAQHPRTARYYLFNENRLMIGRVEPTTWGQWQAFTGRPGVEIGFYDTAEQAKAAVERTLG